MASIPKISFPIPSNGQGKVFGNSEELLSLLDRESTGLYLIGSQGMWHGGIHITDATAPWGRDADLVVMVDCQIPSDDLIVHFF